jgi:hypothetical protein
VEGNVVRMIEIGGMQAKTQNGMLERATPFILHTRAFKNLN